jgi:small-conductance mechanosensitive channel
MRDTIENYVASLLLSLRQPFRANDWVQIDTYEGRVIRLTSRATVLMTLDGNHLRIPNGQVFKAVIVNFTRNPQRRFHFDLGVDADDDARAARQLGRDTLAGLEFVLSDPPPEARIIEVGDSNVVIRFLGWVDQRDTDWWKAQSQAIPAVKGALEDAGFGLPEPIYRLRFDPRSATVPFAAEAATATATPSADEPPQAKRAVRDVAASPADEDVRPADEIAAMVEEERNRPGEEQNKDLLDHSRPVE